MLPFKPDSPTFGRTRLSPAAAAVIAAAQPQSDGGIKVNIDNVGKGPSFNIGRTIEEREELARGVGDNCSLGSLDMTADALKGVPHALLRY